jgi:crotonobetainyl-CoA:carnitine CoA-transferase CaiB-like acyl-CoA transferase
MMTQARPGPLAGFHVVELGDGTAGPFCAKMLGDYGAEVVKVETPAGDSSRQRGPFPDDTPDPEASGLFHYLNTNKRGVVLDLGQDVDRARLDALLARADAFVTNVAAPDESLAPAALRTRHPRMVITSISPFGTDGPWAQRRGDELITYAMGGIAYSTPGMPDAAEDLESEPPLHPACFAAETVAGVIAATGTLSALLARARSGQGCHVEVSQQAAVAAMQQRDVTTASYTGAIHNRMTDPRIFGRMPNFYLPCKDGHVAAAAPADHLWERLVEAMGNPAWAKHPDFADGAARAKNWRALRANLSEWTRTLTGDELYALAGPARLPIFQLYTLRRMAESDHVAQRGSLARVEIGGKPARMPGAPITLRGSPWSLRSTAPRLGQHSAEVFAELGA